MNANMTMRPERRWACGKAMCIQRRARWARVGMTVEATAWRTGELRRRGATRVARRRGAWRRPRLHAGEDAGGAHGDAGATWGTQGLWHCQVHPTPRL